MQEHLERRWSKSRGRDERGDGLGERSAVRWDPESEDHRVEVDVARGDE